MKRKVYKRALADSEQENEDDSSLSVIIPSRSDSDWRHFVRNCCAEVKQIVLDISRDHRSAVDYPRKYFNQALYPIDLRENPLKPYWGYFPLSNEISMGTKNNQRIGNRIQMHRISLKVHPYINATLRYVGNQTVTFYLYYYRAWRGRLNLEHEAIYRYNEPLYQELEANPNGGLQAQNVNLMSASCKFLDVNTLDNVVLLAKKAFNINDQDATILTPTNLQNINQIDHTTVSTTGMLTWEVDVDVNAMTTYRAYSDIDYNMTLHQATVRQATSNVEQGMFFITYSMDMNYSIDTDIDFLGNAALYYTDC